MTQPPPDDHPTPGPGDYQIRPLWESSHGGQDYAQQHTRTYQTQHLLPQDVRRGKSYRPVWIGLCIAVALAVIGTGAYFLLRGDGEENRAEYCQLLSDVTNEGDLTGAVTEAVENRDLGILEDLERLQQLAPRTVADSWDTIGEVISTVGDPSEIGPEDLDLLLPAYRAYKQIEADAEEECGLSIEVNF